MKWDCWLDYGPLYLPEADMTIEALGAEWAAEKFAEVAYSDMDMWEGGTRWPVFIREAGVDGPPQRFDIQVDFDPTFSASKSKIEAPAKRGAE